MKFLLLLLPLFANAQCDTRTVMLLNTIEYYHEVILQCPNTAKYVIDINTLEIPDQVLVYDGNKLAFETPWVGIGVIGGIEGYVEVDNGEVSFPPRPEDFILKGIDRPAGDMRVIISGIDNPRIVFHLNETIGSSLFYGIRYESFYFPNIFSPNGDGKNDVFEIGEGIKVFNRWGEKVFEGESWDGGNFPAGVYVWLSKHYKGDITLIR